MIDPRAVDRFLKQPCDSHVWIKSLTNRQLDDALADQGFRTICPERPLRKHQKACILLALAFPQFSLWLDMGTGKTRIVLELLSHYWQRKLLRRIVICCISELGVNTWVEEIEKWGCRIPFVALGNGPSQEKWEQVAELPRGVILVGYAGLVRMVAKRQEKPKRKRKKKRRLQLDKKLIKKLSENLDAFIPDESTHLGNRGALISRVARLLSKGCWMRHPLAGRPFGRDPITVWQQQYIADRGESLGETLGIFRGAFFTDKKGYFGGYEYTFKDKLKPLLAKKMGHRSISYSADECLTLPAVSRIRSRVTLSDDVSAYYERAVKALRAAKGDSIKINNIFLRMRQLSSGFLGYKDDDTGERAEVIFDENPKLDDLLEKVDAVPLDRKFVIFHEFNASGKMISDALKEMGIKHGRLWGGTKNSAEIQRRFNTDPDYRGLVINHKMGGMSLNLQTANYMLIYESPVGVVQREQMERRCFRDGQKHPGFLYDLIARDTMDAKILAWHRTGDSLLKALLRDPGRVLDTSRRKRGDARDAGRARGTKRAENRESRVAK